VRTNIDQTIAGWRVKWQRRRMKKNFFRATIVAGVVFGQLIILSLLIQLKQLEGHGVDWWSVSLLLLCRLVVSLSPASLLRLPLGSLGNVQKVVKTCRGGLVK